MTIVRHLVLSDVRRFRWPIAALLALTALSTAVDGYIPSLTFRGEALASLSFTAIVLWITEGLLTALLIARMIQGDRLVGTTAFWMTRPIDSMTLLAAKTTVIAVLTLIWPVFCEIVLMAFHRVPAGQLALGAVQDLVWRALIVLALMSAASITANMTRFVVLCVSMLVVSAIATALYASFAFREYRLIGATTIAVGSGTVAFTPRAYADRTADILRVVFTVMSLVAMIVVQYRHRSVRRAVLTGLTGIALAMGIARLGPASVVRADSRPPAWASEAGGLRPGVETARLDLHPTAEWELPEGAMKLAARAQLAGVAPGWFATARIRQATVTLADGTRLETVPFSRVFLPPEEFYGPGQLHVVKEALGVRSLGDDYSYGGAASLFVARRGDVARISAGPFNYRGTLDIDLTRLTVAATLPLQRGAAFQDGSYRLVLADAAPAGGALVVGVRTSNLQTVFDRHVRPSYSFYLRNMRKSEAVGGTLAPEATGHLVPFLFGLHLYRASSAGFTVYPGQLRFHARGSKVHIEEDLTEAWLRDAELVILKSEYAGTVERVLALENIVVTPPRR